jgi:hypothetical protein
MSNFSSMYLHWFSLKRAAFFVCLNAYPWHNVGLLWATLEVQSKTLIWPHVAAEKEGPEEFACACVNYHHIYVKVARSLNSIYYKGKSDTRAVLSEKKFLHIFGRKFVDTVKFAMEMCVNTSLDNCKWSITCSAVKIYLSSLYTLLA